MARQKEPTGHVKTLVDFRDAWRCFTCGRSLAATSGSRHHRQLRRHGDHSPANLILLCGSGTTGCHGEVHDHPARARTLGLIVLSFASPESVPAWSDWRREWVLLDIGGQATVVETDEALEMLEATGHRSP